MTSEEGFKKFQQCLRNSTFAAKKQTLEKSATNKRALLHFWKAFFSFVGIPFFAVHILYLIRNALNFATPILLQQLLSFIQTSQASESGAASRPTIWMGLLYCTLMFLSRFGVTLVSHQILYQTCDLYMKSIGALQATVFQKALRLTSLHRKTFTSGELMNLVSTDVDKIASITVEGHYAILSPETFISGVIYIYYYFGLVPTIVGVATLALVFPLSILFAKILTQLEEKRFAIMDEKLKVLTEVISSIRNVKFFTWEQRFQAIISSIRSREYHILLQLVIAFSLNGLSSKLIGLSGAVATFTTYALLGGSLADPKIFASLIVFSWINGLFGQTTELVNFVSAAYTSSKRFSNFLSCDEIEGLNMFAPAGKGEAARRLVQDTTLLEADSLQEAELEISSASPESFSLQAVRIYNASFSWNSRNSQVYEDPSDAYPSASSSETHSTTLSNINLTIEKGDFVVITGSVSSGKSSLLNAIFGDCPKISGELTVEGKLAYCDQTAWIMNGTVRDNILFGKEFDQEKYKDVLRVTQLEHDLGLLSNGDQTEIGEQGVNLSGGQKMRLALARACYTDADIFLFDSILNAVDPHVQKRIFKDCLMEYLRGKTRILVTYSLPIIAKADHIVIMENGRIKNQGSYKELSAVFNFEEAEADASREETTKTQPTVQEGSSVEADSSNSSQEETIEIEENIVQNKGKLVAEEDRVKGRINMQVIMFYFLGYGPIFLPLCLVSGILSKVFEIGSQSWLSVWSARSVTFSADYWYLIIYVGLSIATFASLFAVAFSFTIGSLKSANRTHDKMVSAVLNSPMRFFDTNPSGRILNRFAKDQSTIDSDIVRMVSQFYLEVLHLIGSLILICIITPWFMLALIPCSIAFFFVQLVYRKTSIECRRMESLSRSPLYSHFNSCIQGSSTIRACRFIPHVTNQNYFYIDQHVRAYWNWLLVNRWLGVRLEGIACVIVFLASLFAVFSRFAINASYAALAINNSLIMTDMFIDVIRSFASVESNLTSMERVYHYCNLKQEGPFDRKQDHTLTEQQWPQKGEIKFDNLCMRYREDLEPVLKGITVSIRPGEKVGIVGRTGSGKSSLIYSLLRLVEPTSGRVIIDGVDTTTIGLRKLRQSIVVIPQDVHMFSGSIRSNIDVFHDHTDYEIWRALERVHIRKTIESLFPDSKLEESIAEQGSNLSVGMKQLLLLARSILSQEAKIVVLDECTANVDLQSDALIQKTIREEYKDATILMIAHRLETIIDADKILVMSNGNMVEFDSPKALLNNQESVFHKMAKGMGNEYLNSLLSKAA